MEEKETEMINAGRMTLKCLVSYPTLRGSRIGVEKRARVRSSKGRTVTCGELADACGIAH